MITIILVSWAALALGLSFTALTRTRRPALAPRRSRADVIVLRPVDAPTAQELANLRAPLPEGIRQIVLSPYPLSLVGTKNTEWVPSDPPGLNRKLGHLRYGLGVLASDAETPSRVLAIDADVAIDDALIDDLLGALDSGADCAWASPRPEAAGISRGLLVQSVHSFDVLDAISAGPPTVCGKALALGPDARRHLGELPDCVGEDLELSTHLAKDGLLVRLAGLAKVPGREPSIGATVARFTRWMQVLRAHRPWLSPSVPLLLACTPALVVAAAISREPIVLALSAAVVAVRTAIAMRNESRSRPRSMPLWWFPAELLLLVTWVAAMLRGGSVEWRGRTLRLGAGGVLTPMVSGEDA